MSDTLKGVVKWFNDAKGFGFIEHSSGKDVFVHYSVIQSEGFKTLKDGEVVEYEVSEGPKGLHAQKVQRVAEAESGAKPDESPKEGAESGQTTTRVAQAGGFTIAVDSSSNGESDEEERAAELAALDAKKEELSSRID